jgi:hypothetical protein
MTPSTPKLPTLCLTRRNLDIEEVNGTPKNRELAKNLEHRSESSCVQNAPTNIALAEQRGRRIIHTSTQSSDRNAAVTERPAAHSLKETNYREGYAERTKALLASKGEMTTFAAYTTVSPGEKNIWAIAENPDSWLSQRRDIQKKILATEINKAIQVARNQSAPLPAINAMRGNSGVGKTRLASAATIPELIDISKLPVVNPDLFKKLLREETNSDLSHRQLHIEASQMSEDFQTDLLNNENITSFLVDRRLGSLSDILQLKGKAENSGKKLNLFDVDAPLEDSLIAILMRRPGGDDPIVPFEVVANEGFEKSRGNRKDIINLYRENPEMGRYELYGSIGSGQKELVATVENGKLSILNRAHFAKITATQNEEIANIKNTLITPKEIERVTCSLDKGDYKDAVIEALQSFKGLTWEQAIKIHEKQTRA